MNRSIFIHANVLFVLSAVCGNSIAEVQTTERVYKNVGERQLKILITRDHSLNDGSNDTVPAIVFFHGGGWVGGKPGQFTEHAKYFATRGLTCFQVEYRLLDRNANDPPEVCIEDAVDAMRWVREHGREYSLDSTRIASAGGSAGGHLAAYVGCVVGESTRNAEHDATAISAKSNAMLLFNPVYDNGPGGWGTKRVGDRYQEFSPAHNLTKDDPPSIVFLGTKDDLIPVDTAVKFRDTCQELSIYTELHLYEGQAHGFFNTGRSGGRYYYETVTAADRFLNKLGWLEGAPTLQKPPELFGD